MGYGFAAGWGGRWEESKRFFLKKEAKTFAPGAAHEGCRISSVVGAVAKVFWFFFSKKNFLLN
jgi:hypothetical protein